MIPKISKAVIPAAGLGTRMLPATKILPKEMLPVAGKPMIQYAVEEAALSGIETVILIVNKQKSLLEKHFRRNPALEGFLKSCGRTAEAETLRRLSDLVKLVYVEQRKPLGLAHAIWCARDLVADHPFAVLLPDVIFQSEQPVMQQLTDIYRHHPGNIIAIREVEPENVQRCGIVRVEGSSDRGNSSFFRVTSLVEKPAIADAPSLFGVAGRYLLEPSIFKEIEKTPPDAKGEIQLTDALNQLCSEIPVYGLRVKGAHYDAGDPLGLLKASLEITMSNPQLQQSLRAYLCRLHLENTPQPEDCSRVE